VVIVVVRGITFVIFKIGFVLCIDDVDSFIL
jgi:hypothetical protein